MTINYCQGDCGHRSKNGGCKVSSISHHTYQDKKTHGGRPLFTCSEYYKADIAEPEA